VVGESAETPEPSRSPRVFVSYAMVRGDDVQAESVRQFWMFLRSYGIDARLDLSAAEQRQDWSLWMAEQVREADFVLVIASPAYRERAEGRSGPAVGRGVQWEARLIRDAFYGDQYALNRFVPVVLPGQNVQGIPDFLAPAITTVYEVSDYTVAGAEPLLRLLTGQPAVVEPALGTVPRLPERPAATSPPPPPDNAESRRPTPTVRNEISGNVSGTVIQAGSIDSVVLGGTAETPTRHKDAPT
jgi:TIR domain